MESIIIVKVKTVSRPVKPFYENYPCGSTPDSKKAKSTSAKYNLKKKTEGYQGVEQGNISPLSFR